MNRRYFVQRHEVREPFESHPCASLHEAFAVVRDYLDKHGCEIVEMDRMHATSWCDVCIKIGQPIRDGYVHGTLWLLVEYPQMQVREEWAHATKQLPLWEVQ